MTNLGVLEMAGATDKLMLNSRAGSADFDQNESASYLTPSDRMRSDDGFHVEKKESDLAETTARLVEDSGMGSDDIDDVENDEVVAQLEVGAGQVWVPPPEDTEDYVEDDDDDDNISGGEGGLGPSETLHGLKTVAECRLREKVGLLLRENGILTDGPEEDNWQDIVTRLAMDAAKYIQPAVAPATNVASGSADTSLSMDPRDYVKVNCLATGKKHDSWVVKGIACHKNVAHRRMASKDGISAPRILLLSGALEFSASSKSLSSIDIVLDQEEIHLDRLLEHIAAADKPDIMLVEKTVSRTAQDRLLAKHITLVQNVKYQLMESIARCTAAQIIPGTEDLAHVSFAQHGVLGLCKTFKVERFVEDFQPEKKAKTLMYFQGCPRRLGCTVVLCGGPLEELKQVKEVIKAAVFAAYHLRVECYFLRDENAVCIDIPAVSRPLSLGATPDVSERSTPVGSPPNGGCSPGSPRSPRSMITRSPRSLSSPQSPSSRRSNRSPPPLNHAASLQQWQARRAQSFSHRSWGSADLKGQLLHATESSNILVAYSKRNKTTLHVCEKLQLRRIDFYGNNDRSLGSFLRDDLLNPDNKCRSCDGPSEAHVQSFSHQLGSITVFASRVPEKSVSEKDKEEASGQSQNLSRAQSAIITREGGRSRERESVSHGHSHSWSKDKESLVGVSSSQRDVSSSSSSHFEVGVSSQQEAQPEQINPNHLPGGDLGKVWMWTVCLRCGKDRETGEYSKSTRVDMSEAAKRLSFGRFLELSFSPAGANGFALPNCCHLVHRDSIRFFGYGVMRGGFCYSPLVLHDVKVPPLKLELSNPIEQEWLLMEARDLEDRKKRSYDQLSKFLRDVKSQLFVAPPSHLIKEANEHVKELETVLDKNWLDLENEWSRLGLPRNDELLTRPVAEIASLNHMRRVLHVVVACWEQRLHCFATRCGLSGFRAGVVRQETRYTELKEPYLSWWNNAPGSWEPAKVGDIGSELLVGEGSICLSPAWSEPSLSGQAPSMNKESSLSSIPASGESILADSTSSGPSPKANGPEQPLVMADNDASHEHTAGSAIVETTRMSPSKVVVEMPDGSGGLAVCSSPALAVITPLDGGGDLVANEPTTTSADSEGCRLSSQSSLEEVLMMVETMASPRNRVAGMSPGFARGGMKGHGDSNGELVAPGGPRSESDEQCVVDLARMDEVWSGEKEKERTALLLAEGDVDSGRRSGLLFGAKIESHAVINAESTLALSPGIPKPSPPRRDREAVHSFSMNAASKAENATAVAPAVFPAKALTASVAPVVVKQSMLEVGNSAGELATKQLESGADSSPVAVIQGVEFPSGVAELSMGADASTALSSDGSEGAGSDDKLEATSPEVTSPTQYLPNLPSPGLVGSMSGSSSGVGAMIKSTLFLKKNLSAPSVLPGSANRNAPVPSLAGIQDARGCARMLLPLRPEAPVVGVYDDEPTTVVAYALSSKVYATAVRDKKLEKTQGKTATGRDRSRDRGISRSREDFSLASLREDFGLRSSRDKDREEDSVRDRQEVKDVAGKGRGGFSEDIQMKEGEATAVRADVTEIKVAGADVSSVKGKEGRDSFGGIPQAPSESARTVKGLEGIELIHMLPSGVGRRLSQGDVLSGDSLPLGADFPQDSSVGLEGSQQWLDGISLSPDGVEPCLREGTPGSKASSPEVEQGRGLGSEESRKEFVSPPDTGRGGKACTSHPGPGMGGRQMDLEMLNWPDPIHVSIPFQDNAPQGKMDFAVTAYYAPQFEALRLGCLGGEDAYISSLSRCKKWQNVGGKSTVYFAKTQDERLIVKQLQPIELSSFLSCAPKYFKYLHDVLVSGNPTCLAKILGVYQVVIKTNQGKQVMKMDILVMENLLYGRNTKVIYDLKGSIRSRYNRETADKNKVRVLLDENLLEDMTTSPIFVGGRAKRVLERAVWNDTSFLADLNVMDYSLLVGIDDDSKELVVGIIDYIRQYTWDKHLETWVKASGILGGSGNPPTVISPGQYKQRFRKAMGTYFIAVPEDWTPSPAATSLSFEEEKHILPAENRDETEKTSPSIEDTEEAERLPQPTEGKI